MAQDDVAIGVSGQEEMYVVSCIHCGNRTFKFSKNYLHDCGEVTLVCPACGEYTKVKWSGEIRTA